VHSSSFLEWLGLGLVSQGLGLGFGLACQGLDLGIGDNGLDNITAYRPMPTFLIIGPSNFSLIGKIFKVQT